HVGRYRDRSVFLVFFFQAEDGIRDFHVTGVQTCALPISLSPCSNSNLPKANSCQPSAYAVVASTAAADSRPSQALCRLFRSFWRSEERRVGKECRCRWGPGEEKKKSRVDIEQHSVGDEER